MNTGQTMLGLGALILLSTSVLTVNKNSLLNGFILQQTEMGLYAVTVAVSRIEDATSKAFDEKTIEDVVSSPSNLTAPSSLGKETGELMKDIDDFDDYQGLIDTINVYGTDSFRIESVVSYVDTTNLNTPVSTPTFHKMIRVTVSGAALRDTVSIAGIFSYWTFR